MTAEQRGGLKELLSGGQTEREIPFGKPDSLTKVYAISSGKGACVVFPHEGHRRRWQRYPVMCASSGGNSVT